VLPKAWANFLRELPFKVSNIQSDNVYKFWPIAIKKAKSSSMNSFCKDLLQNVIENLDIKDHVFKGPFYQIPLEQYLIFQQIHMMRLHLKNLSFIGFHFPMVI
jgi:hypothetical protein